MKSYYTPSEVRVIDFHPEKGFLYSGLKDMPDNPVYPGEELDDDN